MVRRKLSGGRDSHSVPQRVGSPVDVPGVVYYTDNALDSRIAELCQRRIAQGFRGEIVSASLKPLSFGTNFCLKLDRGYLAMFRQILAGLEASRADFVFLCEHDVLYHDSHFTFRPSRNDLIYYNTNVWKVRWTDGFAVRVNNCKQTSGLCACRQTLLDHYRKRVMLVEKVGFTRRMGFEPGTHRRAERVDDLRCEMWSSEFPNLDIRHATNLTRSRWSKGLFRNQRCTAGWTESQISEIPGWDRFDWKDCGSGV